MPIFIRVCLEKIMSDFKLWLKKLISTHAFSVWHTSIVGVCHICIQSLAWVHTHLVLSSCTIHNGEPVAKTLLAPACMRFHWYLCWSRLSWMTLILHVPYIWLVGQSDQGQTQSVRQWLRNLTRKGWREGKGSWNQESGNTWSQHQRVCDWNKH